MPVVAAAGQQYLTHFLNIPHRSISFKASFDYFLTELCLQILPKGGIRVIDCENLKNEYPILLP